MLLSVLSSLPILECLSVAADIAGLLGFAYMVYGIVKKTK